MAKKPIAPTERSEKDMYKIEDKEMFLSIWLDYVGNTPESRWSRDKWVQLIRSEFDEHNPKSQRTDEQRAASILTKAKSIRSALLRE